MTTATEETRTSFIYRRRALRNPHSYATKKYNSSPPRPLAFSHLVCLPRLPSVRLLASLPSRLFAFLFLALRLFIFSSSHSRPLASSSPRPLAFSRPRLLNSSLPWSYPHYHDIFFEKMIPMKLFRSIIISVYIYIYMWRFRKYYRNIRRNNHVSTKHFSNHIIIENRFSKIIVPACAAPLSPA